MVYAAVLLSATSLLILNLSYRFSVVFAALFACLTVIFVLFKPFKECAIITICALLLCINYLNIYKNNIEPCEKLHKEQATITGIVLDASYHFEDSVVHYVKITDSSLPQIVGKTAMLNSYNFAVEDAAEIAATVTISSKPKFSFYSDNVYLTGHIDELYSNREVKSFDAVIAKMRAKIRHIIFDNLPYDIATTINGLTIGDRSYEEDDFYNAVKNCGVSHVLVVSGSHMVIVSGSLYTLLNKLKAPSSFSIILTFIVTILFMALCGFSPSVIRAGFMYMLMLIGKLLHRDPDALNSLSVSLVLMLIFNPFLLYNIAFLLSVLSTAGIIILNPLLLKLIKVEKWRFQTLRTTAELATVTISAGIATLPVCLICFGWISPWILLVNMIISFAVTVAVVAAFIGILLDLAPSFRPLSDISFMVCSFATAYLNKTILFFGNL